MAAGHLTPNESRAALIAGLGLLLMSIAAILADLVVLQELFVPGDPRGTAMNLMAAEPRFRAAVGGIVVVLVLDIVVAWALYLFLERVHASLSLLAAWLRIVYAAVLGIAISALIGITVLAGDGAASSEIEPGQLDLYRGLLFEAYYAVWGFGYIIFGAHLLLLGILASRSDYVPRLFAVLLPLAGVGYIAEYAGRLLSPQFDVPLSLTGWGEVIFMFWLLWTGVRRSADVHPTMGEAPTGISG